MMNLGGQKSVLDVAGGKRQFKNNLHHKQQCFLYGSDYAQVASEAKQEEHYWTEYRRNYEFELRKKMEQDRVKAMLDIPVPPTPTVKLEERPQEIPQEEPPKLEFTEPQSVDAYQQHKSYPQHQQQYEQQPSYEQQQFNQQHQYNSQHHQQHQQQQPQQYQQHQQQQPQQYLQHQQQQPQHYLQHQQEQQYMQPEFEPASQEAVPEYRYQPRYRPQTEQHHYEHYDDYYNQPDQYQYLDYYNSPSKGTHPLKPVVHFYNNRKPPLHVPKPSTIPQPFASHSEIDQYLPVDQPRYPQTKTYQIEPHNYSVEQVRYLDRMKRASLRQNMVYRQNLQKHDFMSEKEKYAKQLESDSQIVQLPINNHPHDLHQGRRIPLGKSVNSMEMRNPEARQHLKEMLEFQMREKEIALLNNDRTAFAKKQALFGSRLGGQQLRQSASQQMLPSAQVLPRIPTPQQYSPKPNYAGLHHNQQSYGGLRFANPTTPQY